MKVIILSFTILRINVPCNSTRFPIFTNLTTVFDMHSNYYYTFLNLIQLSLILYLNNSFTSKTRLNKYTQIIDHFNFLNAQFI